jgi:RimJ/RimL family protein N-acetyltransferase
VRIRAPDPPLSDGVVTLRPWMEADADAVAAACRDPEITRWLDAVPSPYTRRDARAYIATARRGWKDGSLWTFAVTDAETADVLGSCGVGWQDRPNAVAEIGYWVRSGDRGRGVATRAVELASQWVFDECGVARLQLRADSLNVASQRVAERAGFQREGVLRSVSYSRRQERRVDYVLYSLLRDEPRP